MSTPAEKTLRLPLVVEEADAEWATKALTVNYPGVEVTRLRTLRIMHGSATKVWLELDYNQSGVEARLPRSMVLKAGFDPKMRELAAAVYEREALFFIRLAPTLHVALPTCYFAGTDKETGQSAMLLEDLTARGCTFGHIGIPLNVDVMAKTLELLAGLHSRYWGHTDSLLKAGFASNEARFRIVEFLLGDDNWSRCMNAPRAVDIPDAIRDRDAVASAVRALREYDAQGPRCLIHGDAHLGNMYFEHDGAPRFLDWQAATVGSWIQDVAYATTCALSTKDRRVHEQALLRHYLSCLTARGVDAPAFDAAWLSYRRQVAYGILGLLCTPEMQSEEYAKVMGTRFALAMNDLRTLTLLA